MNPAPSRVLVCGGTGFTDWNFFEAKMNLITKPFPRPFTIIHGNAPGADSLAGRWALENQLPVIPFPITKAEWKRFGRNAGPRRNQKMLVEGKPELVLAFPGGRGTADMKKRAEHAGILVIEFFV